MNIVTPKRETMPTYSYWLQAPDHYFIVFGKLRKEILCAGTLLGERASRQGLFVTKRNHLGDGFLTALAGMEGSRTWYCWETRISSAIMTVIGLP